jgi:hypothetical protein
MISRRKDQVLYRKRAPKSFGDFVEKSVAGLFNHACHSSDFLAKVGVTFLLTLLLGGCSPRVGANDRLPAGDAASLNREERHKLYSAALAASDSPLDTELFKAVCRKIEIFDAAGNPNGNYMPFVQEHIAWGLQPETNQFRLEINTKEKALDYVAKHLP